MNDTVDPAQTASNVIIRDNLPSGLTLVSCTATGGATCSGSGSQVQVSYGTIGAGQSVTVSVVTQVDPSLAAGTLIENPVSASSDQVNLDLLAGTASTSFVVLNGTPVAIGVSPVWGSGTSQNFSFQFSHPSGYQYLGVVNVLMNDFLDGRKACYLAYDVPSTTLLLVNDTGDAGGPYAGSVVLGGATAIQNSQCSVSLVSAAGNGTTLTLTVSVSFKPLFAGNRIAYVAVRDLAAGNTDWQALGVWSIPGSTTGPVAVVNAAPPPATATAGASQPFTFMFTAVKGAGDFGILNVLINNAIDGRNACYLAYDATLGRLFLVNDTGDAGGPFAGSMPIDGNSGGVQNSQCAVGGAGSTVSLGANSLTLTLQISFTPAFRGNRIVYAAARDAAGGNNTNWKAAGTVSVR